MPLPSGTTEVASTPSLATRGRRAGRLRRGMDAVRRQPVVDRADAARRRLRKPEDELEVEEVVAALVERTGELEPAPAEQRARLHDVVRARSHHRLDVEPARLEREDLATFLVDEERAAVDEQRPRLALQLRDDPRDRAREQRVVRVQPPEDVAPRACERRVERRRLAAVGAARPPREAVLVAA